MVREFDSSEMSLQNLCVKLIVENFERYFTAFSNSEDVALKRRFEFLQRKYSYEMASLLYEKEGMKAEYIDFFINKHLKVLDFDWLKDCSWEKIVAKFQEVGSGLQHVDFCNNYFETPLEDLICHLKNVEGLLRVYFYNNYFEMPLDDLICHLKNVRVMLFQGCCCDEILRTVAKFCHNILAIHASYSNVTDMGIKYLCTKENWENTGLKLKYLFIYDTSVTNEGIAYLLKHMSSIKITNYEALAEVLYSMHENDLPHINELTPYNLQKLDLSDCHMDDLTDLLKICSHLCPRLKSFSITFLEREYTNLLSGFCELEELEIYNFSSFEVQIDELLELIGRKLHYLCVANVTLSVFDLAYHCPLLMYLQVYAVNFIIDSVNPPVFSCLEKCIFRATKMTKSIRLILTSSPKLECIAFQECDLSSNKIKMAILKCCEQRPIKKVFFSDLSIDISFLKDIVLTCHTLKKIYLDSIVLDSVDEDYIRTDLAEKARSLPNSPQIVFNACIHEIFL